MRDDFTVLQNSYFLSDQIISAPALMLIMQPIKNEDNDCYCLSQYNLTYVVD